MPRKPAPGYGEPWAAEIGASAPRPLVRRRLERGVIGGAVRYDARAVGDGGGNSAAFADGL